MSKSLSVGDVHRLRRAMQSAGTPAFASDYKRLLRGKLNFDTFLLIIFMPETAPVLQSAWLRHRTVPSAALVEYCDRTYRFDPFFQFRAVPEGGGVYHLPEITPDRFFSSEYYLEYYRKAGLCDEIGLLAPLPQGGVAHLSMSRLGKSGAFRQREVKCLKHYAPVLLELLVQHQTATKDHQTQNAEKKDFSPLSEVIRIQSLELFKVRLTEREAQIAALVLLGHSNGSSALQLGIARETCRVHRRNLYRKLSISSQGELFTLLIHLL